MKRILLFIIALAYTIPIVNAQLKSRVSECFELTSIVFRLAGAEEYVNNQLSDYTNTIDHYFAPYTGHPLIPFLKEIRMEYGIGYNAVAIAATYIVIKNGKVMLHPDVEISRISEFDSRWNVQTFKTFVTQLNDFYRKTKFRNLYLQHSNLYKVAEERMDALLINIKPEWFISFFDEELEHIDVIVSLCNGPSNYALPAIGEKSSGYIVIGSAGGDREGLPWFSGNMLPVIVHELLHHHTNRRINACWEQVKPAAQQIFSHVKEKMSQIAYGDAQTMLIEWFTNLCKIVYVKDNPTKNRSFEQLTGVDQYRGFIWMDRSVQFMKHFYENRHLYKTIDDYMPQIVGHINFTADHFDQVTAEYEKRCPYIVEVFPAPGSTIPQDINTIEVRFSQVMSGSNGTDIIADEDVNLIPFSEEPFWKDEYTFVLPFDPKRLEKGKTYGMKLPRAPFQNRKMFAIKEDYIYTFKTNHLTFDEK